MQVLFRTHWLALRAQASPSCSPGKEGGLGQGVLISPSHSFPSARRTKVWA